jgi:hypothetical protein
MNYIRSLFKICWLPHTYKTVKDDGSHKYEECRRCGHRKVTIAMLGNKTPNYNWVNHETDTI